MYPIHYIKFMHFLIPPVHFLLLEFYRNRKDHPVVIKLPFFTTSSHPLMLTYIHCFSFFPVDVFISSCFPNGSKVHPNLRSCHFRSARVSVTGSAPALAPTCLHLCRFRLPRARTVHYEGFGACSHTCD